jgi:hypothetical protein
MRYSPFAILIPAFLAELTPPFALWIVLKRGSVAEYLSQINGDESVLPSSTSTTSKELKVWLTTLSKHLSRYSSAL